MMHFKSIDQATFLRDYWQKKALVIRDALPNFIEPIDPDDLAGLALEEDVESRIVIETPGKAPFWQLKTGPFVDSDFAKLPPSHWTLLVQGVDRLVPEVAALLSHFDFIPAWRFDDVMISYAVNQGSVGPHYDNYDVFLYQARGRRQWSLTTQHCHEKNYLTDVPLRIMQQFDTEEEYILEAGDMLYLPPHVGHHGVSLSDDCMTYSFGYRSYQGQELWDSLGDYLSEQQLFKTLYKDPDWSKLNASAALPPDAWLNAKQLMLSVLDDEQHLKKWFGCFATRLDQHAEQQLPAPLSLDEQGDLCQFIQALRRSNGLVRNALCRIAYMEQNDLQLFINGQDVSIKSIEPSLVKLIATKRWIELQDLLPYLDQTANHGFLYELWTQQWFEFNV